VTAAVVIQPDDLTDLRRILEVAEHVFDSDDPAHRLAVELLEVLDRHDLDPPSSPTTSGGTPRDTRS